MAPPRATARSMILAVLVVTSVTVGSVAFTGNASAAASNLSIVSDQPVAGSGTVTVRVTVSTGESVSFKVADSAGTVSGTKTVTDGTSADAAPKDGVVETTLDLSNLFGSTPESGTALVYAGTGGGFSIEKQTYDTKRQVAIDAEAPTVTIESSATGKQGEQVRIDYTITDVPQQVSSAKMRVVDADGNTLLTIDGLQAGTGATAQFVVPPEMPPGEYDVTLTAVDEAGHRTIDTRQNGLTVRNKAGRASNLRIVSHQPVAGSGDVTVTVLADGVVSFKIADAAGTISAKKTVSDGGSADLAATSGAVTTTLDLGELYADKPVSGTAIVYAGGGDELSVAKQTFDTKRQVALDSDSPSATVVSGGSARQGEKATVTYTVTDVPQKISSLEIHLIGPDGLIYATVDNLQAGKTITTEISIPSYAPTGEYDAKLVTVDEVGHRATDRLDDSVTVKPGVTSDTGEQSNGVVASDVRIVSTQPVEGSGDLVVRTHVSDVGVDATFQITDSTGRLSATKTVTDGGSADRASKRAAVVETTLDLSALYESPPESGTAVVYVAGGDTIDVETQAYQTKRQVVLDADAPTVKLHSGATAAPGTQVKIPYSATDEPQKLRSVTMKVVGPDGNVYVTLTDLQAGEGRAAQFVLPSSMSPGEYYVRLVAVDEVGHRSTTPYHGTTLVVQES